MTEQDDSGPSAATVPAVSTKRKARRKRVFKGARLGFGGASTIDCIVKDISASGARIRLSTITPITGPLQLLLSDKERLDAEIIRQTGVELGLRFTSDQRPSMAPPPEVIEQVLTELESPWLSEVLSLLERADAYQEPDVHEAAAQLREAYDRLKVVVEGHVTTF
ncbi:PilZ domain-containing protein [uncultured Rhodospira sp.]|uniref:PilZ domain-containing protein n=1 Tax=uncultured Rhodospira sp. TaxID=1936189 RepID=UPI0026022E15|nr:PilZ domain-containing protein [uncultured Rhodospira sp.]